MILQKTLKRSAGFSLVEMVVYVTLLFLITATVSIFILGVLRTEAIARSEQATIANITFALQAIEREVRHAEDIYTPTSVFASDSGQLALRTPKDSPTDHIVAFTDIYLDNGVVYMRRDDTLGEFPLTSGDVSVSVLRFDYYTLNQAAGVLVAISAAPEGFSASISAPRTITTFVTARIVEPQ